MNFYHHFLSVIVNKTAITSRNLHGLTFIALFYTNEIFALCKFTDPVCNGRIRIDLDKTDPVKDLIYFVSIEKSDQSLQYILHDFS